MYWRDDFEIISHEYELYTNQMTHCYYFSGFETATSWQNLIYAVSFNRHLVEHFDLIADNQWMETTMSGDKNQISHWWIHTNQFLLHKKKTHCCLTICMKQTFSPFKWQKIHSNTNWMLVTDIWCLSCIKWTSGFSWIKLDKRFIFVLLLLLVATVSDNVSIGSLKFVTKTIDTLSGETEQNLSFNTGDILF